MITHALKHCKKPVGICSAASRRIPQSVEQKKEWAKREVPWMPESNVVIVNRKRDKIKFVGKGNILVDDYHVNVDQWKAAGGIGILFESPVQTMIELQKIIQAPASLFKRTMSAIEQEITSSRLTS
jgi:5'(3')-deoxyribonucleotidase